MSEPAEPSDVGAQPPPPWDYGRDITMAQLDFIILERSVQRAINVMNVLKNEGQITVTDWEPPPKEE